MSRDDFDRMEALPEHDDLERRLRQYRPLAPPPRLRERIVGPQVPTPRIWPWATAAAAMLATTIFLHASSTSLARQTEIAALAPFDAEVTELTEMLGGGVEAERMAREIVEVQAIRASLIEVNEQIEGERQ